MFRVRTRIQSRMVAATRPAHRWRERGAAAVELAIVLPMLLLIALGILDFGLYFYSDLQLTHAARDVARSLSVGDFNASGTAIPKAEGNLPHNIENLQWSVDGSAIPESKQELDALAAHGDSFTLQVTGTYKWITPLPGIMRLFKKDLGEGRQIDASATMRRE